MEMLTVQNTPLRGPTQETKIHNAAEGFVGTFLAQMVDEMFKEVAESSEESNFETELYGSFLARGIGEKIAASSSARTMVQQVENKMRRQAGLEEVKRTSVQAPKNVLKAYTDITKTTTMKETKNVCTSAA